jgi:hypothetical protein
VTVTEWKHMYLISESCPIILWKGNGSKLTRQESSHTYLLSIDRMEQEIESFPPPNRDLVYSMCELAGGNSPWDVCHLVILKIQSIAMTNC